MKNKKNNSNNNKLIIALMIIILILVSVVIFILNYSFDNTSLTIIEKKWITENSTKMIDVSTYNDVPIFGKNGKGIIFDFLNSFSDNYDISFNKISYYESDSDTTIMQTSFKIVPGEEALSGNDIHMYDDYYGLLSIDYSNYKDVTEINGLNIGILESDKERIKYYLGDDTNKYTEYSNVQDLFKDLKEKKIDYTVLPINQYIDYILSYGLNIDYKITGLYNKYIMSVSDDTLYSVFNKYYTIYTNEQFSLDYGKELTNIYFDALEVDEASRVEYNSKVYHFGYVIDTPFTINSNNYFDGIIASYLREFSEIVDIDIEYIKYNNVSDLINALKNGEVDFTYTTFYDKKLDSNHSLINIPSNRSYTVLAKDYYNIDSLKGLKGYNNVYSVNNSYVNYLLTSYGVNVNYYDDTDDMLRNIDDDSIVVVDSATYDYYASSKFKSYLVIYSGKINSDYSFTVNNDLENDIFNGLLNIYVSLKDYSLTTSSYINDYNNITLEQIKDVSKYLLVLFIVIFIFLLICLILINRKKREKLINRDDKLKYIDLMTSLKNRNYLNSNIKKWTSNRRYPQAVIIVDLNNIKYINDNYGHEEGDNEIKKAANVLIINQLENSDIMRTDGNEFLIYLLGYDEKQIISYCHKLIKELRGLPHGFGATLGHSMILDDVKTIEDAINEATIEMRKAKEKLK